MTDDDAGWREQQEVRSTYARPTEGTAVAALVCAILAWIVLPVVMAIVALVLARIAQDKIDESGGRYAGEGLITAAKIIAWINLALAALILFITVAIVALILAI